MRGRLGRGGTTGGFKWARHLREVLGGEAINELEREASKQVKWELLNDTLKSYINRIDENDEDRDIKEQVKKTYNGIVKATSEGQKIQPSRGRRLE